MDKYFHPILLDMLLLIHDGIKVKLYGKRGDLTFFVLIWIFDESNGAWSNICLCAEFEA